MESNNRSFGEGERSPADADLVDSTPSSDDVNGKINEKNGHRNWTGDETVIANGNIGKVGKFVCLQCLMPRFWLNKIVVTATF